jgi:hypothetical protein
MNRCVFLHTLGFAGFCQTLVHGAPNPELGAEFINEVIDMETPSMLAKKLSNAPAVQGVQLPPETLARMPHGEGQEALLFVSDGEFIDLSISAKPCQNFLSLRPDNFVLDSRGVFTIYMYILLAVHPQIKHQTREGRGYHEQQESVPATGGDR